MAHISKHITCSTQLRNQFYSIIFPIYIFWLCKCRNFLFTDSLFSIITSTLFMLWGIICYNIYYILLSLFRVRLLGVIHLYIYYVWHSREIMKVLTKNYVCLLKCKQILWATELNLGNSMIYFFSVWEILSVTRLFYLDLFFIPVREDLIHSAAVT
jgi:hypothetical protein